MRLFTRFEVLGGLEYVPREGAAILAINHLGSLDTPLVYMVVNREDLTGWVADKYRSTPFIPTGVKWLDGIWLDREGIDISAIKAAHTYLKEGRMLGIAPEGTRSHTGALIEGKNGVAYLAANTGTAIIPAAITGTESVNETWQRLRRPRLTVRFGESFNLPPLKRATREMALQQGTDEVMCRIAALLPPTYRGIYADHPRLKVLLAKDAN
jgi:1-acyl-sn-glycerol-3-phosphate acyltransferase